MVSSGGSGQVHWIMDHQTRPRMQTTPGKGLGMMILKVKRDNN